MRNQTVSLCFVAICALHANPNFAQSAASTAQATMKEPLSSTAQATPGLASRTVNDILQLIDSYKPDPGLNAEAKKLAAEEPPATDDPKLLAAFYKRRADALADLGLMTRRLADLREAIRLTEGKDADLTTQAAIVEFNSGNHLNATALLEATAKRYKFLAWFQNVEMVRYSAIVGDLDGAKRYLGLAEADIATLRRTNYTSWLSWRYHYQSALAKSKSHLFLAQGKYADAEAAMRECLDAMEQDVEPAALRRRLGMWKASESFLRAIYATQEGLLAHILMLQGKLTEAEWWARSSLNHQLESGWPGIGRTLTVISQILAEQARFAEADAVARRAIEVMEHGGAAAHTIFLNEARLARADALVAQGSWVEAVSEYVRRREGLAGDPEYSQRLGVEEAGWAIALLRGGKADEAKAMLELVERRLVERVGAEHYDVAEVRGFIGIALMELGDKRGALARFRKATEGLFARDANSDQARTPARALRLNMILEAYIGLLRDIHGTALESEARIDAVGEAFTMADAVRGQSTQRAMAASAARAGAAGNPQLAALIRKEQDLANESNSLLEILLRLAAAPKDQQLPKVVGDMRARVDAIAKERKEQFAEIERGFPQYANLVQPRLVTLAEARALLKPDEVVISIFPGTRRSFVWVAAKEGDVAFHASALTAEQIGRQVGVLRTALDIGAVPLQRFPEFDLATAHGLYRELLLPVRDAWKHAKSLLVVTSGPLAQIPFAILPTEPAALAEGAMQFEGYKSVPWLIRQAAIAQLPSVNALVTLRTMPASPGTRKAFVGFGDPVFGEQAALAANARSGNPLPVRNLKITRVTEDVIRRNQPVDWTPYSSLAALPDTRDEVLAIAGALKADKEHDVFLGRDASKEKVRSVDLASRRIIAFATHGLLPGDFPGVDQPALALAAPPGGAADKDPRVALLTLDDILTLKLDADWVVLSACNSAAGDGKGSDAISGLGRAFFYAGSRALLVTHWPVESHSARRLVVGVFERYTSNATVTRSEALQASMLALMNDAYTDQNGKSLYSYAHPMFWAPYALVGDSGR